jgi:hypothetical protein
LPLPKLLGTLIILSIPLMAIFGVFGEHWAETKTSNGVIDISVKYPVRYRYKLLESIRIGVTNKMAKPVTATVALPPQLIEGFSSINFIPPAQKAYEANLEAIQPRETRLLLVEIQAKEYGRHAGAVSVSAAGTTVTTDIGIFVFP